MADVSELFARQAEWQRSLRGLSWAEKIKLAEGVLESVRRLRQSGPSPAPGAASAGSLTPSEPDASHRK